MTNTSEWKLPAVFSKHQKEKDMPTQELGIFSAKKTLDWKPHPFPPRNV